MQSQLEKSSPRARMKAWFMPDPMRKVNVRRCVAGLCGARRLPGLSLSNAISDTTILWWITWRRFAVETRSQHGNDVRPSLMHRWRQSQRAVLDVAREYDAADREQQYLMTRKCRDSSPLT